MSIKTKLKILKNDMEKYLPYLQKRYVIAKFIIERIEIFIQKDVDKELLVDWYKAHRRFIRDIEREIREIESRVKYGNKILKSIQIGLNDIKEGKTKSIDKLWSELND